MMVIVLLGAIAATIATQFIKPLYAVRAKVWIAEGPDPKGPIRAQELLTESAWRELLTSYAILEPVAADVRLFVAPRNAADSAMFRAFDVTSDLRPGAYTLTIDEKGRYALSLRQLRNQVEVERGAVGDSIGRTVGFRWAPAVADIGARRKVTFEVMTPREAAVALGQRLVVELPEKSNFMNISLTGEQPAQLSTALNRVLRQFVSEAEALKKKNLTDVRTALEEQLERSKGDLQSLESTLESWKVATATLPTEKTVVAGGSQITTNPALTDFFNQRQQLENVRRDREALESVLAGSAGSAVTPEALLSISNVVQTSPDLSAALTELTAKQTALRGLQQRLTDEHPLVKDAKAQIDRMLTQTIPAIAAQTLDQIRRRERDLDRRISAASTEIRSIPARTVEEQRLTRERDLADKLYQEIKSRYEFARLAEASAIPDVSVLDTAVAPQRPVRNTKPRIFAMVLAASLGLALLVAIGLDLLDKRFRYPEQATSELGLDILGGIPRYHGKPNGIASLEDATQLVESFRALRLNVRNAADGAPSVSLTISSPGPGDGKSFVSANLALTFAEAGYRTLLVDGDIRRGALDKLFQVEAVPGLVDHLAGDVALEDVIRETSYPNLFMIPCGTRRHRGPELLAADHTARAFHHLRARFDAIIVDSAPLGAGIDSFALAAATSNMLLVLRTGQTDRKLAQAKLTMADRLPIRVIGAVLNDIEAGGIYKYYSYIDGYGTTEDESGDKRLVASGDRAVRG
jgi:succinoglycan biosynthesis transport protein ExoP